MGPKIIKEEKNLLRNFIHFSKDSNKDDENEFLQRFNYLHALDYFNKILNVILTLGAEKRLSFNISTHLIQDNKHGLCETLIVPLHTKILNKVFSRKTYQISLKKLKYSVIIHECAHAIEKEVGLDLSTDFMPTIQKDFVRLGTANTMLKHIINDLMIKDLMLYGKTNHASELFARYFELFALTQEISGEKNIYLKDVEEAFVNTQKWVKEILNLLLEKSTNSEIRNYNQKTRIVETYKTNWQTKFQPVAAKKWDKKIGSNFN